MSILVGVGQSTNRDTIAAANEAFDFATRPLFEHPPSLQIVLASSTVFDQEQMLKRLKELSPQSTVMGCSTSGEITTLGPNDHSLAIMAIYSDQIKFTPGVGSSISLDPRAAGAAMARDILQKNHNDPPKSALMFPDGLAGNGADIVRGVLDVFGENFIIAGGSAGDDFKFEKTYEYYNDQLLTGSVVGFGLSGNFTFGIGVRHGWIPIGTARTATRSKSNVLYELDHKPAIEMYTDHFGPDKEMVSTKEPLARMAITYPLGIRIPGKDEFLVRDPITVDEHGAITCAAEIPEGSEVQLMIGSKEEAIDAAQDAAREAMRQLGGKPPKAAILFNCIARKKMLMSKKDEEITHIREIIGNETPLIGFYTYGEQAPLGNEILTCSFHNETDVLFLLAE